MFVHSLSSPRYYHCKWVWMWRVCNNFCIKTTTTFYHIIINIFCNQKNKLKKPPSYSSETTNTLSKKQGCSRKASWSTTSFLTSWRARWGFLQKDLKYEDNYKSQVLLFQGLGEYKQKKISTVSDDFSHLCPFIYLIPPNILHSNRAYAYEQESRSYLGLIFASSIIFLKSSLACIILFFFSLRSSSARVFTYWSNTCFLSFGLRSK